MLNVRELIPWSRSREISPGRREVEHPFLALQREMDRLFDEFWRGFDLPMLGRGERGYGMLSPRLDVREDEKSIVVTAELPGMDESDVQVTLTDNSLIIEGEKKSETEESERGYRYAERSFGSFRRVVPIDAEIIGDKVEASFHNGVLTVVLPKTPEAEGKFRKIPVKSVEHAAKAGKKAA
jgi:HSP20 family protein